MAYAMPDSLRRIANQLRETTEEYGRGAAEGVRDLRERSGDTRAELARLWSQIEDIVENRVTPAARTASHEARHYAGEAQRYARLGGAYASDATDRLREATRAHPLLAIGIAVGTTWAVINLLGRRR